MGRYSKKADLVGASFFFLLLLSILERINLSAAQHLALLYQRAYSLLDIVLLGVGVGISVSERIGYIM